MNHILERIAKSLGLIAEEFKASRKDREEFRQRISNMENALEEMAGMFGITRKE